MSLNPNLNKLSAQLQGIYADILKVTQQLITNQQKTGIIDNVQRAEQDQEQSGQLSFIIVGILRITQQIDGLAHILQAIEQDLKYIRNRPTSSAATSDTRPAQTGSNFITYNPPEI